MARSDLLVSLVKAASQGDRLLFRRSLEAIVAEERRKKHNILAEKLAYYLENGSGFGLAQRGNSESARGDISELLFEVVPRRRMDELILSQTVRLAADELTEEQHRMELLRSFGLEPRHRLLLVGPPGNGKTSFAEALAEALMVPLYIARYDGIIGSYLGETAVRVRRIFDFVRNRHCVLFFDEFDTIGKERGDVHETGEIKRVVSSLLLQIDQLPSHVVVIAATNHPELMDRAVWRRFELRLPFPNPTRVQREAWFEHFICRFREPWGLSPRTLADKFPDTSFSELEQFGLDVMRRFALVEPGVPLVEVIKDRLRQWQSRVRPEKFGE